MSLIYISEGKIYRLASLRAEEIKSGVLEAYTDKLYRNAKRNEWKTNGTGARFTGTFDPYASPEAKLGSISSVVDTVVRHNDTLIYSQTIDGTSGIYSKRQNSDDGIILSDNAVEYAEFDKSGDTLVVTAYFAGESHIGKVTIGTPECEILTEGSTLDRYPSFSERDKSTVYYSSQGFEIITEAPEKEDDPSLTGKVTRMRETHSRELGPASILRLDTSTYELDEILSDNRFDFIKPKEDKNGNLYYIKKPYQSSERKIGVLGCLLDIILFPFRLIMAILGFLDFFSLAFSGKTIRKSGGAVAKGKDNKQTFIDGNLIEAEKELKANTKNGDKFPGIIPRSYELCRRTPDNKTEVVKKGVIAYTLSQKGVYVSNGSGILLIKPDGSEEKISDAPYVTYIYEDEEEKKDD